MSYVAQQPRKRFQIRFSELERKQIDYVMQREGIPDLAKAIRYCIVEKVEQLKADDRLDYLADKQSDKRAATLQKKEGRP